MRKEPLHLYEFGPFRLDATDRRLLREGAPIPLTPKVFDTLLALVEAGGRVVGKDELMQALWPDTYVEENSLTQNISVLRKALGEETTARRYIETVPRRGYRFVAEVRAVPLDWPHTNGHNGAGANSTPPTATPSSTALVTSAPHGNGSANAAHNNGSAAAHSEGVAASVAPGNTVPAPSRARRWPVYALLAAALLAAVSFAVFRWRAQSRAARASAQGARSVAVLPFKTFGPESEQELLGLGMADAVILRLGKLEQPTILPTGTIFKYTKRDADALAIGRELGVEAVLDGTIQHAGDHVRVTAQLIRLSDGQLLWSGKFDEQYRDIFAVQDSISEQLADALTPQMTRATGAQTARRMTQNTEAYQAYLMGLYFWNLSGKEGVTKAVPYFERAVALDQNFALAYAYLGDCYYFDAAVRYGLASYDESLSRAQAHTERALQFDETIAEAHATRAGLKTLVEDYATAEREYKRALALNPNFALSHNRYGVFLFHFGDLDGAVRELRRGQELDPVSRVTNGALANMLLFARAYDDSIKYSTRALEIDPDASFARLVLGEGYMLKGRYDEAIRQFNEMIARHAPERHLLLARIDLINAYAYAGRRAEAEQVLKDLLQSPAQPIPYSYATAYAALGDKDNAFAALAQEKPTRFRLATYKYDPFLDPLRTDPRFQQLLQTPPQGY
ncbi:MAG TPA: winged helix-turn-helix domain-containing protein [Pyrinomonadaceae bacterium]|jgi:DNA-binding winged helix-turn-helix (wHTH) protein/TolB-like protein/Tfp pilus assembly protein PilF